MGLIASDKQPQTAEKLRQPAIGKPAAKTAQSPLKKAFERVVMAAMEVLYDETMMQQILALVQKAEDPAQGLAQAAQMLVMQFAQLSKGSMPVAVLPMAAKAILVMIAEMAQAAGIITDQQVVAQALQLLAEKMGNTPQGAPAAPPDMAGAQPRMAASMPAAGQPQMIGA